MMSKVAIVMIAAFALMSCTPAVMSPEEYSSWVKDSDNGLVQNEQVGNLEYEVSFKPVDLMIAQSLENLTVSDDSMETLRKEYSGFMYFTFRMRTTDKSSVLQFEGNESTEAIRLQHFFNDMQSDFTLLSGSDTLSCAIYHYERDYGVDPYETFSLGFEAPEKLSDDMITLLYTDQVMKTGPVRFVFDAAVYSEQPHLKF